MNGKIGLGYWYGFKQRHTGKLCPKRGRKYELDRDSWTTYVRLLQMYDLVYEEMKDDGIAVRLENPEWQDYNGNVCDAKNVTGCRITHDLTHTGICIVMDEVGSNTSQKAMGTLG